MTKLLFLALCAVFLAVANARYVSKSKIVGGFQIEIAEVPYQVSLQKNGRHNCGGSIIADRWVLTAAHCVTNRDASLYTVRVGSTDRTDGGELIQVEEVIPHESYNDATADFDFALLLLSEAIGYNDTVQAIELAAVDEVIEDGTMSIVSGWGATHNPEEDNQQLRATNVPTVNQQECVEAYSKIGPVTEQMICAGYKAGGQDSCQGDSGGPLAIDGRLVGVVSWGQGCAEPDLPGVYARVSAVREWIQEVAEV
ncbi:trypsin 3A1-like [Uranotaenia lowii]|uniref:trypsin 3A1-like n=1 Tax=Uranotaenia lowii TaxID=190385 RepID=UPI002478DD25|nr:trypsin 3A1-like [Uranotaenia lowii]